MYSPIRMVYLSYEGLLGPSAVPNPEELSTDFDVDVNPLHTLASELRKIKIATGVLANVSQADRQDLSTRGAFEGFTPVMLSCDVGAEKPDRYIYHKAVEASGSSVGNILYVDRDSDCIRPARKLGMQVLLASSPQDAVTAIKRRVRAKNGDIL